MITDVFEPRYSKRDVIIAYNKVVNGLNLLKFSSINDRNAKIYGGLSDEDIEILKNTTFAFEIEDKTKLNKFTNNGRLCVVVPLAKLKIYKEPEKVEEVKEDIKEEIKEEVKEDVKEEVKTDEIKTNSIENLSGFDIVIISKNEYNMLKSNSDKYLKLMQERKED